ncbi:SDR family oxidoreductase [Candidatus Pelagibacter bacterium]|nr:SDR family oxidoreductase [Candidatus Pelagibacter bacterium]MDA8844875.1 SDR family oxidoreductase [Candidatus Pelagibacter bacterium]
MSNLFFGGSSDIALKIAKNLKNTDAVSSKKVDNSYRKVFEVKNYNYSNLNKLEGEFTEKYNNIVIFNGLYSSSFLSLFNRKNFIRDFEINFLIPIEISNFIIKKKILKKNGAIYFISSIAASENLIGNASYSISKNALNFSAKILSNEQNKRNIRVNTISLGLIKNQIGIKVRKMTNTNKKFVSIKDLIKKIKIILKNNRINKKNINIL